MLLLVDFDIYLNLNFLNVENRQGKSSLCSCFNTCIVQTTLSELHHLKPFVRQKHKGKLYNWTLDNHWFYNKLSNRVSRDRVVTVTDFESNLEYLDLRPVLIVLIG